MRTPGPRRKTKEVSVIFENMPFAFSLNFSPFDSSKHFALDVFNEEYNSTMCSNMSYFDALCFNEGRSEDAI